MEIYKVVRKYRGKLESCNTMPYDRDRVIYEPNKLTKPKLGKLFAFSNLKDAKHFAKYLGYKTFQIWLAQVKTYELLEVMACDWADPKSRAENYRRFWSQDGATTVPAPAGTVVCAELKLVRKVA